MEASELSYVYCNDTEGAISLLLLSRHWRQAAALAIQANRKDLFKDEVYFFIQPYHCFEIILIRLDCIGGTGVLQDDDIWLACP